MEIKRKSLLEFRKKFTAPKLTKGEKDALDYVQSIPKDPNRVYSSDGYVDAQGKVMTDVNNQNPQRVARGGAFTRFNFGDLYDKCLHSGEVGAVRGLFDEFFYGAKSSKYVPGGRPITGRFAKIDRNKIEKIRPALQKEFIKLGVFEEENPFITFVNLYFKNNDMSAEQYFNLHNEYIDGSYLNDDDLRGKGILGMGNIIFNKTLYLQTSTNIHTLLWAQRKYSNESEVLRLDNSDDQHQIVHDRYIQNGKADANKFLIELLFDDFNAFWFGKKFDKNKWTQAAYSARYAAKSSPANAVKSANYVMQILSFCFETSGSNGSLGGSSGQGGQGGQSNQNQGGINSTLLSQFEHFVKSNSTNKAIIMYCVLLLNRLSKASQLISLARQYNINVANFSPADINWWMREVSKYNVHSTYNADVLCREISKW